VLFGNDTYPPPTTTFDALNNYVLGGGKLILNSWTAGYHPAHPLWTTLGFAWIGNDYDPPAPIYWWAPGHPFFNLPMSVPEFASPTAGRYGNYGQYVEPLAGFQALAGYTTPGADPGQAALILGQSESTVFKGFTDGQNDADLDSDGVLDGIELWIDMIAFLQGAPPDVPWLSESPTGGTVLPGECADVTVTFDSTGLVPGDYLANLLVDSNDPDAPQVTAPMQLHVLPHGVHLNRAKMNARAAAQPGWSKVIYLGKVHNELDVLVAGITVEGYWTYPDGTTHQGTAVGPTNNLGQFKFRVKVPACGLFQFDVTNMYGSGYVYDPSANDMDPHLQFVAPCE